MAGNKKKRDLARESTAKLIGDRLRRLRERRSVDLGRVVSQAEVGAAIGLNAPRINAYERGKKVPGTQVLTALAGYYGVTLDDLVRTTKPTEKAPTEEVARLKDELARRRAERRLEPILAKLRTLSRRSLRLVRDVVDAIAIRDAQGRSRSTSPRSGSPRKSRKTDSR